jgi:putative membrane protein
MTKRPMLAAGVAAGLAAALLCGAAAAQSTNTSAGKASQKFMTNAIEGDLAEIDVGKLAQQKGTTQAVRDFGQTLVSDHTANKDQADKVAQQLGMSAPTGSSFGEKAEYLKLKVLSGKTFDRTFAKDMVSDHQKDIKAFQRQAAKSGPAADFAKQSLPTLQKHLQMAQDLQNKAQTTGSK